MMFFCTTRAGNLKIEKKGNNSKFSTSDVNHNIGKCSGQKQIGIVIQSQLLQLKWFNDTCIVYTIQHEHKVGASLNFQNRQS